MQLSQDHNNTIAAAHILVVDDEIFNRQLLHRVLHRDYQITEAEGGQIALELIQDHDFDLVLLDIMMPDMSGLDVLQMLRQHPATVDLPVIVVSALDQTDDIVTGLQLGASDYIPKPIDIDIVSARVKTQLRVKQALDTQKQAIVQFQRAQALKDKLLSIASHDLKSPLANVLMIETLLRSMLGDDPEIDSLLDTLNSTVNRMNSTIVEFLDMAAVQSGTIEVTLEDVALDTLIEDVVTRYGITSAEKDIAIRVGDVSSVAHTDSARLLQVLSNLVSNAVKYSPLSTEIALWTEHHDGGVTIYVADQGPGIPAEERGKLFTEFGRLSTHPTAGESSTGLGLWIVKQMVELMQGEVGVDCPPDGGSTFWVKLPSA